MNLGVAHGKRLLGLGCLALVVIALSLRAGETEPFGPPGPTMKPLFEIEPRRVIWGEMLAPTEPYRITEPGLYYLAEDIDATGKWGIEIAASRVTLDLNGFALANGFGVGIRTDPGAQAIDRVVVRNGTV